MPWITEALEHFLRHVPASKLSLGIITGGMHRYTSQEDRIQPEMARSHPGGELAAGHGAGGEERREAALDDEQQVAFTRFARGVTFECIFLEDARSFEARLALAERRGLRGFSRRRGSPARPGR